LALAFLLAVLQYAAAGHRQIDVPVPEWIFDFGTVYNTLYNPLLKVI
jgi:hypothetical protein